MGFLDRFFPKKEILLDPINPGLLINDIHSHLIPGIDDGSPDMNTTIQLLEKFIDLGYKKVITTPHIMSDYFKNTSDIINSGLEDVRNEIEKRQLKIQIEAAAEYNLEPEFERLIESGNILTFGNQVIFDYGLCSRYHVMYNSNDNKIIICYNRDSGTGGGVIAIATVIGNEITVNSSTQFDTTSTAYDLGAAYDSTNNKVIVSYRNSANNYGIARVIQPYGATTNLKSENYIGIAAESIAGGATGKINIVGGVNTNQTGLTTAKTYYVQIDGSLATTPTDPAVVAGTSIGATKIIVKG